MLKLEFKTGVTVETGEKNGKKWTMYKQDAWIVMREKNGTLRPNPERFTFLLPHRDGDLPPEGYPLGVYDFDVEASLYQGDFNALRLGRPVLHLVPSSEQKVQPVLKSA